MIPVWGPKIVDFWSEGVCCNGTQINDIAHLRAYGLELVKGRGEFKGD